MRLKKLFPLIFGLVLIFISTISLWADCHTSSSDCYFQVENIRCQFSTLNDCPWCDNAVQGAGYGRCCHFESGTCVLPETAFAAQGWLQFCDQYCN